MRFIHSSLKQKTKLNISGVVIDGLPSERLLDSAKRQLKLESKKLLSEFLTAMKQRDDRVLVEKLVGIPFVYFDEKLPSLQGIVKEVPLGSRQPNSYKCFSGS